MAEEQRTAGMLALAAGLADAKARLDAAERDRARIDGELAGIRRFNHDLREMGLLANWAKVRDGHDALERVIEQLKRASDTCDAFQAMMRAEPGGPLAQLRELADAQRARRRLVIWAGAGTFVCTTVLNVGWLLWKWAQDLKW